MTEKPKEQKERDPKTGQLVKGHEIRKQSGAWIWFRTGRVPEVKGSRRLRKHLNGLKARLMEVVPNSSDPRREVIIGQIVKCEGFCLLLEEYLKRAGILDPVAFKAGRLETQGSMMMIISLLNTQARAIASLGMAQKEGEEILDLGKYIELKDKEKTAKEEEKQP